MQKILVYWRFNFGIRDKFSQLTYAPVVVSVLCMK